jgi:ABC-2 type transport system permease protein
MVARAVSWRSIHNSLINPAVLVPSLVFPLFFLAAFAGGLSSVGRVRGFNYPAGYTAFQYVFVVLQSSAFGGVFTGFAIARDFEVGFARRLLLSAPNRIGIVVGYAISAMARSLLTVVVVTAAALIGGMNVRGSATELIGLYTLGLLVNLAATLWGCGVAMRLRTIQAGSLIQMPVFILLFLAPVYVPRELLSGWISAAANVNPVTPLLTAGRGLIAAQPTDVALAFAALAAMIALLCVWALGGLRSAERAGG